VESKKRTGGRAKAVKFTDRLIQALPLPTDRTDYFKANSTVRGMSVRVTKAGGKIFNLRHGAGPRIVIGPFPTWSVAKAEARAKVLIGKIADGENPIAEYHSRKARKRAIGRDEIPDIGGRVRCLTRRSTRTEPSRSFSFSLARSCSASMVPCSLARSMN
jgi:hypothetical protein